MQKKYDYDYRQKYIRQFDSTGKGLLKATNVHGLAQRSRGRLATNAECAGTRDGDAYTQAFREFRVGCAAERQNQVDIL